MKIVDLPVVLSQTGLSGLGKGVAAGYLMGWEWPLGPRAILRPSLPWPSTSTPGWATETGILGRNGGLVPGPDVHGLGWLAETAQGGNTEALGSLPCGSPLFSLSGLFNYKSP